MGKNIPITDSTIHLFKNRLTMLEIFSQKRYSHHSREAIASYLEYFELPELEEIAGKIVSLMMQYSEQEVLEMLESILQMNH